MTNGLPPDFSRRQYDVLDVLEVHDGDTYRFLLDTGFDGCCKPWLRLKGWSAPELKQPGGDFARATAASLLQVHRPTLWVETFRIPISTVDKLNHKYGEDKRSFARYVADVYIEGLKGLGQALYAEGVVKPGAFVG